MASDDTLQPDEAPANVPDKASDFPSAKQPNEASANETPTIIGDTIDPGVTPIKLQAIRDRHKLGVYTLVRRIGKGAMGQVYEAIDTRLNRKVALKILHGGLTVGRDAVARFQREALSAAKLRHPNIVSIHDVGQEEGRPYLVMDLVSGVTLSHALRDGQLSYRGKAALLEKIARAVAHAHDQGIIHRDLKPANIMVERLVANPSLTADSRYGSETGTSTYSTSASSTAETIDTSTHHRTTVDCPWGEPMIMDFGLALDANSDAKLSIDGRAIGTPSYMPPEQAAGERDRIGPPSDIYSLGAILYEMITGRPPFIGEKIVQVLQAVVDDDPVRPSLLALDVPKDLETICLTCLQKEPQHRYSSAIALADDLHAWLHGDNISAHATTVWQRWMKKLRKHPVAAGIIVLSLTLLVVGTSFFMIALNQRAQEAESARDHATRSLETLRAENTARVAAEREQRRFALEKTRQWTLILSDDFSHNSIEMLHTNWDLIGKNGLWSVVDGWLRCEEGTPQIALLKREITGDIRLEFDCRFEGDYLNDVSCFIGARDAELTGPGLPGGYEFKYGGFTNSRTLLRRHGVTLFQMTDSPLKTNTTYHAVAERDGNHLRFSINGVTVIDVIDPIPSYAYDFNRIGLFGWKAITYWDNVRLYRRGEPMAADLLEVAERALQYRNLAAAEQIFTEVANGSGDESRREHAKKRLALTHQHIEILQKAPALQRKLQTYWPQATVVARGIGYDLDLGDSGSDDLSPLADLPWQTVKTNRVPIVDLTPIASPQLYALECHSPRLSDLGPLAACTELRILDLSTTRISDLNPLRNRPITKFHARHTDITDVSVMTTWRLYDLAIAFTPLSDISPLAQCPTIKLLDLTNTGISDIQALTDLRLASFIAAHNHIFDLAPLAKHPLTTLQVYQNDLTSIAAVANCPLEFINCGANNISSLEPLRGKRLLMVHCAHNHIHDLSPLKDMPLSGLVISHNPCEDLQPINSTELSYVYCDATPLKNLGQFAANPPSQFFFPLDIEANLLASILTDAPPKSQVLHAARCVQAYRDHNWHELKQLMRLPTMPHLGVFPLPVLFNEAKDIAQCVNGTPLRFAHPEELQAAAQAITGPFRCSYWLDYSMVNGTPIDSNGITLPAGLMPLALPSSGQLRWQDRDRDPIQGIASSELNWTTAGVFVTFSD